MSTLFIQITPEITNYTIQENLTKNQYRVWLYLSHLDPFGDRLVPIPHLNQLAPILKMSVRSIQRAFKKLNELGLFAIASSYQTVVNNQVKNKPLGTKNKRSRKFSTRDKNVAPTTEISSQTSNFSARRQKCQDRSSKDNDINNFKAPQTNSDFKQTLSDLKEKQETLTNNNQEEIIDFWAEDDIDSSILVENEFIDDRSFSRDVEQTGEKSNSKVVNSNNQAASIDQLEIEQKNHFTPIDRPDDDDFKQTDLSDRDRTITAEIVEDRSITNNSDRQLESKKPLTSDLRPLTSLNWLPPGPWEIDGKLDSHFRDWLAQDWLSRYGGTIHRKRADVLSHFKKDPANLPIRWEQYQSEYLDRFKNAKTRLDNGIAIAPDEKQQLKDHAAAVSKSIKPENTIVAPKKELSPSNTSDNHSNLSLEQKQLILASTVKNREDYLNRNPDNFSINLSNLPENEEKPHNLTAYQYHQPKQIDKLADPKQVAEVVRGFLAKFKSTPKPKVSNKSDRSQLSKLNSWLKDPILYSEAVKRAKSAGYHIDYSRDGVAIRITEPEF